jgi:hypothetical protein
MEQVFGYVNELMARGLEVSGKHNAPRETLRTNLKIVTYTVVPLGPRVGVSAKIGLGARKVSFSPFFIFSRCWNLSKMLQLSENSYDIRTNPLP